MANDFVEPGVTFERIPNPKYAIIPGGTAEVAFIGAGKQTLTQSSVSVVRGANWTAGTVTSGDAAAVVSSPTAYTFNINLNGDGVKPVALRTDLANGLDVAADIQAKVRAIVPTDGMLAQAYSNFTCTFNSDDVSYTLTSGLPGSASTIALTVGAANDILADLLLDAAVPTAGTGDNTDPDTLPSIPTGTVSIRYGSYTYVAGVDYTIASGSDEIAWVLGHGPAYGVTYYVTYEVAKVDADYLFKTYYSLDEVTNAYGPSTDSANTISVAASLFYANGGVKLNIVQMKPTGAGGTYLMSDYTTALNTLELHDIDLIVPLVSQDNTFATLFSVTKEHVYRMSQPDEGKNRMAFMAPSMNTSISEYKSLATSLALDRLVLTAPSSVVLDINNTNTTAPAFYFNAAMTGFMADPDNLISDPLTRKELFGIVEVGTKYTKSQMRDMLKSGVLIVENAYDIIRVVHGITTDRTNLDTSEISLVRISDFFGKTLKTVLDKSFIGSRIDVTTLASIRGMITIVIDNFITNGSLIGAKQISVTQDANNPTLVNVSMIVQPVYPLNFIDIKFVLEL